MQSPAEPQPYKVIVVVDPEFGERLARLPPAMPVWIVDTATNHPVAQRLRKERPAASHLDGITTFRGGSTPEASLIDKLSMIDLHHGPYSANPPYTELEVHGVAATPAIRWALAEIGFEVTAATGPGFHAIRRITA